YEIGDSSLTAQNPDGAGGVGARIHAGAAAGDFAECLNHVGWDLDVRGNHLVVRIREVSFDRRSDALDGRRQTGLEIPGKIEIDDTVSGADLDLGVNVAESLDERSEAPGTAYFID